MYRGVILRSQHFTEGLTMTLGGNPQSRRWMLRLLTNLGIAWIGRPSLASARTYLSETVDAGHPNSVEAEEVMPANTARYLDEVSTKLASMKPSEIAAHISRLAREDADWRRTKCLSLRAAEGIMSDNSSHLLASPLATRVTEGFPGSKGFPGDKEPRGTNQYIDEIEATVIALARKLFHAKYVEWRPISNTMANALPLLALTEAGDVIMSQSMQGGGGNYSYSPTGPGGLKGLTFIDIPFADNFQFDLPALEMLAKEVRPKFLFVGGSYFLFPVQLKEVRHIADEVGAKIIFDAAHVSLLIAGGALPQPLDEGADILTMSSHKIFGGPVGGLVMTNDQRLARKMLNRTLNGYLQTRDQNKYVAEAYSFAEVAEFGRENARQIVQNAQALAHALHQEGFHVLGGERNYTNTHQVILDVRERGAMLAEEKCLDCNILIETARLPGDSPDWTKRTGLRLGVSEITRLGMKRDVMSRVARFIRRATDGETPAQVAAEVEDFLKDFQVPRYTFSA
jgi:glycine hydroxymethyltransferase